MKSHSFLKLIRRWALPWIPNRSLKRLKEWKHHYGYFHPLGCSLIERPAGRCVMVLAAHPDDEVIGCGGTLRKHVLAGERVVGVYLTDGVGTCGGSFLPEAKKRVLIETQSRKAGELLGLHRQVFCRQNTLNLPRILEQVTKVWQEEKPDVVYLPFVMDQHNDHVEVSRLLLRLLEATEDGNNITCVGYEIWSLLSPNRSVDISTTLEVKQRAIAAYGLASDVVDYIHATTGLSAYRALLNLSGLGYAEAFFVAHAPEYVAIVRSVLDDRGE